MPIHDEALHQRIVLGHDVDGDGICVYFLDVAELQPTVVLHRDHAFKIFLGFIRRNIEVGLIALPPCSVALPTHHAWTVRTHHAGATALAAHPAAAVTLAVHHMALLVGHAGSGSLSAHHSMAVTLSYPVLTGAGSNHRPVTGNLSPRDRRHAGKSNAQNHYQCSCLDISMSKHHGAVPFR